MTTYRGTYGDVVSGQSILPDLSGGFLMTTIVDMTVDDVRRVSGDIVSAVVSGNGTITFEAVVDGDRTTRTDTLVIAPTPMVFSLIAADDPLMPDFGAEYGYFGSNNLFFRGGRSFFRDGVELNGGDTTLGIAGAGDYRWTDGTLSLSGVYQSWGELPMTSALPWVRDNHVLNTERGAATNGIVFEIERVDAALEPATVNWWVTGDTFYDYTQTDAFGWREPVLLDDFVGGTIPAGTVSFAAGQLRRWAEGRLCHRAAGRRQCRRTYRAVAVEHHARFERVVQLPLGRHTGESLERHAFPLSTVSR